jgi:hypothetical protein
MYGRMIDINKTLREVCSAISSAETMLKEQIKLYHHDVNEEFITTLFHNYVKNKLYEASQEKHIETAFLDDLKTALGDHLIFESDLQGKLQQEAEGLIADIVLHNKQQEGRTGGDFGLVIVRPQIIKVDESSLEIKKGRTSGLLCQAKLKNRKEEWGRFTPNQKKILPKFLDFMSLVLYSYLDEKRSELNSFTWKSCKGKSFSEIKILLKEGDLEGLLGTTDIIMRLGQNEIGTEEQKLIDEVISPSTRQHFEIRIYWPNDADPKGTVALQLQEQQRQVREVYH